jgi:hypothetical protein
MASRPQRSERPSSDQTPDLEEELRLTVAARKELGAQHEQELIEGFLAKLDRAIEARAAQEREASKLVKQRAELATGRLAISLALGIPLTAISLAMAGFPGLLVIWAGIFALNIYFDWQTRRPDR